MHTNPILLTFCSLLYYKDLNEHLYRHKIEKISKPLDESLRENFKLMPSKFESRLPFEQQSVHPFVQNSSSITKSYNKRVLIRWQLYLTLSLNPELIVLRKRGSLQTLLSESTSVTKKVIQKIKKKIHSNKVTASNQNNIENQNIKPWDSSTKTDSSLFISKQNLDDQNMDNDNDNHDQDQDQDQNDQMEMTSLDNKSLDLENERSKT